MLPVFDGSFMDCAVTQRVVSPSTLQLCYSFDWTRDDGSCSLNYESAVPGARASGNPFVTHLADRKMYPKFGHGT